MTRQHATLPCVETSGLRVVIPGDPCAQGRGRAVRFGAGARVIDPAKSRSWKGAAQVHYMKAAMGMPCPAFPCGPLTVQIDAYFKRPALPKRVGTCRLPRPSRPDCDNLAKSTMDAANGILWSDDAQIVALTVQKWYAAQGDAPRVEVSVWKWAELPAKE